VQRSQIQTTARAILHAASLVGILTLVVKLLATAKEMLVAYRLGIQPALDAFLIAYLFPSFLVNVVGASLTSVLVPLYVDMRRAHGDAAAAWLVRGLTRRVIVLLIVLACVAAPVFAAIVPQVAHGFSSETVALSQKMVWQMAPVFILNALTAFWVGALNARERFALGAVTPALTPLMVMLTLLIGWQQLGVEAVLLGTIVGAAAEALLIGKLVFAGSKGTAPGPEAMLPTRELLQQLLPLIAGTLMMSSTLLVDQMMASSLASGSVAALSFGSKLTVVIVGMGSMALATAFLPHFSRMVIERDVAGIRVIVRQYSLLILAVTGVITCVLVFVTEPITRLLYGRGAFDAAAVDLVAKVQWMYALQIPFFTWSMVAVRLISALRRNEVLMWGAGLSMVLNVVLNLWFSHYLGVAGIALSTSVVAAVACAFLWFFALRGLKRLERQSSDRSALAQSAQ